MMCNWIPLTFFFGLVSIAEPSFLFGTEEGTPCSRFLEKLEATLSANNQRGISMEMLNLSEKEWKKPAVCIHKIVCAERKILGKSYQLEFNTGQGKLPEHVVKYLQMTKAFENTEELDCFEQGDSSTLDITLTTRYPISIQIFGVGYGSFLILFGLIMYNRAVKPTAPCYKVPSSSGSTLSEPDKLLYSLQKC